MTIDILQIGVLWEWVGNGTGPFTVGTEGEGYATPDPGFDGEQTGYLAFNPSDLNEREVGKGTWSASTNQLTRDEILYNGISKAWRPSATAVDFQSLGNKIIVFVPIPDDFGALAELDTITQSLISDLDAAASQAEAEAGTEPAIRRWSPLRVAQAIAALSPGGSGESNTGANVATNGVGVFDGKVGVQLQFRGIASLTTAGLTVTLDDAQNDIDLALIYASQAEAEAGTDNGKLMTALRVAQAIAAQGTGGGAPTNAQYLVLAAHGTLTVERVLTPDQSLAGVDDGAGAPYHVRLVNDSATPGTNKVYGTDGAGVRGWRDEALGAHTHPLSEITDAGALAALNTVGTTEMDADSVTDNILSHTTVTPGAYTSANITINQQGRITAAASGSGGAGLSTSIDSATALTVGAANGTHKILNAATAITLTLSNTATVGTKQAFTPGGAGAVSVATSGGSGYWLPGDDTTGTARTATFVLTGYGYFEVFRNTGGVAAEWAFVGRSNHAQTLDADLDCVDKVVSRPELKDYAETSPVQTGVTGALAVNVANGNHHHITHGAGNITGFTVSNWPATGKFGTLTVDVKQDGVGGRTMVHPAGTVWAGGTPTLDTGVNKTNRITYTTRDAGTVIVAHYGGAW